MKKELKNITIANRISALVQSIRKKDPQFIFFSVDTARKRASREQADRVLSRITDAYRTAGTSEIVTVENILVLPLSPGKERDYSGGLVRQATDDLIEEAIHIRSKSQTAVFAQELPLSVLKNIHLPSIPEINAVVMFGGILFADFGRFLLESLGRLWAYEKVKHLDPYVFFLLDSDPPDYLSTENFAYQIFTGFGIPLDKILFVKEPSRLRAAIIPCQKYGFAQLLRPGQDFLNFLRRFQYTIQSPADFQNVDRIYVSRSALKPGSGKVAGEVFFEDYLKTQGYAIFHPETHTVEQQLSVYSNAAKIIFMDGSALRACVLLPDLSAEVAVIARKSNEKSDVPDQFSGYGQQATWIDCVEDQYLFGLESRQAVCIIDWPAVSEKLNTSGFVSDMMYPVSREAYYKNFRDEVCEHVKAIAAEPAFIDFLISRNPPKEV